MIYIDLQRYLPSCWSASTSLMSERRLADLGAPRGIIEQIKFSYVKENMKFSLFEWARKFEH